MPLNDAAIRAARPGEKPVKLTDGGGLYLLLTPGGSRLWRFRYRFGGRETTLSMGPYPAIRLKDARRRRDEARRLLALGLDPGAERRRRSALRQAESFRALAVEWFSVWSAGASESARLRTWARLEKDVLPALGNLPVAEISAPEVLEVLRRVEERGALATAKKARGEISRILRYAIATARATRDPCSALSGVLRKPPAPRHRAALLEPERIGGYLRAAAVYHGTPAVRTALRLLPFLFARPGELLRARWTEMDFERAAWRYVATKTGREHWVPLAWQPLAILREWRREAGASAWVFPGRVPGKTVSGAALTQAMRIMGYDTRVEVSAHGFRATARTLLAEELHYPPEIIERQLAHRVPGPLGAAYDRARFLKEREAMMQDWANYLEKLAGTGLNRRAGKRGRKRKP
jgi:integrase